MRLAEGDGVAQPADAGLRRAAVEIVAADEEIAREGAALIEWIA